MNSMEKLTTRQQAIRDFIALEMASGRPCPSHREIAARFDFKSPNAARSHLEALIKKGALLVEAGKARALRLADDFQAVRRAATVDIPLYGSIPAGFGQEREQDAEGCVTVDVATIGYKPTRNSFALRVSGDSMIGRHICDGDIVILEHGQDPRPGQIVAALIDRKCTLKTFLLKIIRPYLRAENPKYPDLIPSEELMIQGVVRALIRRARD